MIDCVVRYFNKRIEMSCRAIQKVSASLFVIHKAVLLRVETVIFPANIKQMNQNILEILSTSSSLELKLIDSSCKECRLIEFIAQKYLKLMYVQII